MKILVVSDGTSKPGGWYTYTRSLADALRGEGNTVIEWQPAAAPLSFMTNPLVAPWHAWKLHRIIKKEQPDVIHFPLEPHALMVSFLSKCTAAKCAVTVHGSYGVRLLQPPTANRARTMLKRIGVCITVSNYTKERLLHEAADTCGNLSKKIHVVHNAIEPVEQMKKKPNETKQIISVGGIKPRKGTVEALQALALYTKNYGTNVHFTIVGTFKKEDPYYEQVQNTIYAQSLSEHVTIIGQVNEDELNALFQGVDLLLMPAKTTPDTFEGFGLVYIEANAYGVPCIGPNDSGAMEAISEGVSGFKVDPEDPEAIASAMYAILEESAIKPEDCRKWAEHFSVKNMGKAMLSAYEMLQSA